ncbi:hypothetical protein ACQKPE_22380 [Pseudomonas sp. NPDC089554]|uniref:hypothetical protein n=1 Tax=Pseudomonas sp. NPDC089554 TaxID=3390653 RepID=UPI003D0008D0
MTTDILSPARHVIGSRYIESVKAYILELTGLEIAKTVYGADTFENFPSQVRIYVDRTGIVTDLRNG